MRYALNIETPTSLSEEELQLTLAASKREGITLVTGMGVKLDVMLLDVERVG